MNKRNAAGVAEWVDPDDAPELTEEFFDKAEAFKGDTFIRRGRGRPSETRKELISIRFDLEVLDANVCIMVSIHRGSAEYKVARTAVRGAGQAPLGSTGIARFAAIDADGSFNRVWWRQRPQDLARQGRATR